MWLCRPEREKLEDADTPFDLILQRSTLARNLKAVYDDLISTGIVHVRVNRWIEVSFCLPQKVHQFHKKDFIIEPEIIHRWLLSACCKSAGRVSQDCLQALSSLRFKCSGVLHCVGWKTVTDILNVLQSIGLVPRSWKIRAIQSTLYCSNMTHTDIKSQEY